jgi:hypothetical protein
MERLNQVLFRFIYKIVIACRVRCVKVFSPEEKVVAEELGGQLCEALWILTFPLSKASLGAYSTYRMQYCVVLYLSMHTLTVHYV